MMTLVSFAEFISYYRDCFFNTADTSSSTTATTTPESRTIEVLRFILRMLLEIVTLIHPLAHQETDTTDTVLV